MSKINLIIALLFIVLLTSACGHENKESFENATRNNIKKIVEDDFEKEITSYNHIVNIPACNKQNLNESDCNNRLKLAVELAHNDCSEEYANSFKNISNPQKILLEMKKYTNEDEEIIIRQCTTNKLEVIGTMETLKNIKEVKE